MDDFVNCPIARIESRLVYEDRWLGMRVDTVHQRGKRAPYGVIERADSVIVIPVAPDREILLLQQFRYPTQEYSWELPMGAMDDGEIPEECARREFEEETGLVAISVRAIGRFRPVPALTPQAATVFEARVATMPDTTMVPPDEDEIVGWKAITPTGLRAMLSAGEITDGFTLASLALLFVTCQI